MKAAQEARQGRRLLIVDPHGTQAPCELTTPILGALEWPPARARIELSEAALLKIQETVSAAARPSVRLVAAARRRQG
jgi:hypothetical protein